jgi:hypothetical protein
MEASTIASVTHPPSIVSARQSTLSGLLRAWDPPGSARVPMALGVRARSLTALGRLSLSRGSAVARYLSVGKAPT